MGVSSMRNNRWKISALITFGLTTASLGGGAALAASPQSLPGWSRSRDPTSNAWS